MKMSENFSTWAEINLGAIAGNLRYYARSTGVRVMAVVKANAYGHGAVPVARAALQAGASWLGVARVEEALELRRAGLDSPILLLGYTPPARLDEVIAERIALTVWEAGQIQLASAAGERLGRTANLHLKVDTGMSRLGAPPEEAAGLARLLSESAGVAFEGLFTHFARADETDTATSDRQEKRFRDVLQSLSRLPSMVHSANSAAALTRPSALFDMVRIGIALYGLHPSNECPLPSAFQPALAWKSVLSQVKTLPAGSGVSYGHTYTTHSNERIGAVPVGYADGFRRVAGNIVLICGQRVPVIGRVCMDQVMVQLDAAPKAKPGDEVVLLGEQAGEHIPAEEIAARWGTINYEVTCGIAARVGRVYTDHR